MTERVASAADVYIRLVDVSRSFGATRAVRNVTMDLATRGRIHALVGENGAGKSTCLGVAAGRIAPSSGVVLVDGAELPTGSPRIAKRAGVHAIYQELTIVPALTPEANVFLGQARSKAGWLQEREMRAEYERLCVQLGIPAVTTSRSGSLSVADQQLIEIIRALASDANAILFDEPTASLAQAERDSLFATMHELQSHGIALALVSHNLEEVLEHSDFVTVFRDGAIVEARPAAQWTKREMVSAMLGKATHGADIAAGDHGSRVGPRVRAVEAKPLLSIRDLCVPGVIEGFSFDLFPGEILGIAGLVGSGRTSLLRTLAGLAPHATGVVQTSPTQVRVPRTVREARRRGIALLTEDRKGEGLLQSRSGTDNVTLGEWSRLAKLSFISERRLDAAAENAAAAVGFNTKRLGENVMRLSGGNQQKLMIARWMDTSYPILLADEPTRGVDVGAKAEILVSLEMIVAKGRSMIVVSSELEEVVGLSDRVIVIDRGMPLGILDSAAGPITVSTILNMIFDAAEDPAETGSRA